MFFSSKTRGPPEAWSHTVHVWFVKCVLLSHRARSAVSWAHSPIPSLPHDGIQAIFVHSQHRHPWVCFPLPDAVSPHSCRQSLTLLPDRCYSITCALDANSRAFSSSCAGWSLFRSGGRGEREGGERSEERGGRLTDGGSQGNVRLESSDFYLFKIFSSWCGPF